MFGFFNQSRNCSRRSAIRENRHDFEARSASDLPAHDLIPSLAIAGIFWIAITCLLLLRKEVVQYRPGEYVPHDIVARVDFRFTDRALYDNLAKQKRESAPRVYRRISADPWDKIQDYLLALPDTVQDRSAQELDAPLRDILDSGSVTELEQDRTGAARQIYESDVKQFVAYARKHLVGDDAILAIINQSDRDQENILAERFPGQVRHVILLPPAPNADQQTPQTAAGEQPKELYLDIADVYGTDLPESFDARLEESARVFGLGLAPKIARITFAELAADPNYQYDDQATQEQQNLAESTVSPNDAVEVFVRDSKIVAGGTTLSDRDFDLLQQENKAYHASLAADVFHIWQYRLGLTLVAGILTFILAAYVARFQRRCVRNHARALAMAGLLLAMLLLSELAGIGSKSLLVFGIAPTIVAAMILTIAYDQRFAFGVATVHAIIVTSALNQGLDSFLVLWVGVLSACYLLDELRTRSKLIEVGGYCALAMVVANAAVGAVEMEPIPFIAKNCLYVAAAGFASGFVVLGILPFIEKAFRITTGMTLLELADASQPLLRRLALEAPGTYNHSYSVATLAEAAADAIKANSLLCRVASYYHDVGKIHKPDYFVENQMGGENRHLNLSPSLSLRIIQSHVKDGVELAKEYHLPTSILPIIEQHHGTTVVEYFYSKAMRQGDQQPDVTPPPSDVEFRYPGPKPRSKEAAIVMLCDIVESACRSLAEPTASRLEAKVRELARMRLDDGQFEECDLTLRDLERIETAIVKTLLGIYHGRVAYPSSETSVPPIVNPVVVSPSVTKLA
jgi:putative nucleotidyltransferase with HDIG domain